MADDWHDKKVPELIYAGMQTVINAGMHIYQWLLLLSMIYQAQPS